MMQIDAALCAATVLGVCARSCDASRNSEAFAPLSL